jgi:ketosteroid isomerase-like protein
MVRGRQAIEQFWQSIMGMGVREVDLQTQDVEAGDDLAYEIGAATLKFQSGSGPLTTDTVKYVVVWKRRAGGPWQLAADIWNSND